MQRSFKSLREAPAKAGVALGKSVAGAAGAAGTVLSNSIAGVAGAAAGAAGLDTLGKSLTSKLTDLTAVSEGGEVGCGHMGGARTHRVPCVVGPRVIGSPS